MTVAAVAKPELASFPYSLMDPMLIRTVHIGIQSNVNWMVAIETENGAAFAI